MENVYIGEGGGGGIPTFTIPKILIQIHILFPEFFIFLPQSCLKKTSIQPLILERRYVDL